MNKAKMLLSGIALFAVVGTGLAFKAHKVSTKVLWTSTVENACIRATALTTTATTTIPAQEPVFYTLAGPTTSTITTTCTATTFTKTTAD